MNAPDQQLVQEIARGLIEDNGRRTIGIVASIYGRVTWELDEEGRRDEDYVRAVCDAVDDAIRSATITTTWPDKRVPAELCSCGCPKVGDGCNCRFCNEPYPTQDENNAAADAAEHVCMFLEAWRARPGGARPDRIAYVINSGGTEPDVRLHATDLDAILDQRKQLLEAHDLMRVAVANATPDHEALADDAIAAHEENDLLRAWLDELGYDAPAVEARLRKVRAAMTRTSEQWCFLYGVEVQDPDGWRRKDAPAWDEPIALLEFWKRAASSTLRNAVGEGWGRVASDAAEAAETARSATQTREGIAEDPEADRSTASPLRGIPGATAMAHDTLGSAADCKALPGDKAAALLAEFLNGMPLSKTRLNDAIRTLLDERDDDRDRLRAETAFAKELLQRNVELGTRADNAEAELAELRAQLRDEWRVRWGKPGTGEHEVEEATSEGNARYLAGHAVSARVQIRQATPWRNVEVGGSRPQWGTDPDPDRAVTIDVDNRTGAYATGRAEAADASGDEGDAQ